MRRLLPLAALLLAVPLAACGGGGSKSQASSSPCPSGTTVVHMKDIAFHPETASVKVGDTVCWVNDDDVQHDVSDTSGNAFQSSLYGNGKSFSWKATKAGTISYVCTVHPNMTGTLKVTG